ncbi:hypothetical protein BCR32DRAFT_282243 [Anaeromyces robustus]|uniref:Uncharacterized protein n=1 Tax=Anaeromyces robustus TaxID=1754192 RepID=A0A1Y1WYL9_9FUNG|nr:hypothetical protein BCR32DRAFT_282243 [Anaeromyces robustus]|eukprot:ORX78495.1 hypothetical protein BCR32DRAFT_282243 [Anaeromyces robustus]
MKDYCCSTSTIDCSRTALHHSCKYGNENIIKYLIEHVAVKFKQENITKLLIERDAY